MNSNGALWDHADSSTDGGLKPTWTAKLRKYTSTWNLDQARSDINDCIQFLRCKLVPSFITVPLTVSYKMT